MKKKTASYAKPSIMEVLNKTTREQRSFGNRVGIIAYGMEDYSADAWPSESWKGIIQTPAFQIVDAASTLQWRVQVKVNNAIAGPGVLKIGCAELRPVESPKEIVNYTE